VEANVQLDRSQGTPYAAVVQRKEVISGKSTTYRLDLSPWGPNAGANDLDIKLNFRGN